MSYFVVGCCSNIQPMGAYLFWPHQLVCRIRLHLGVWLRPVSCPCFVSRLSTCGADYFLLLISLSLLVYGFLFIHKSDPHTNMNLIRTALLLCNRKIIKNRREKPQQHTLMNESIVGSLCAL